MNSPKSADQIIKPALEALRSGDRAMARDLALDAALRYPNLETPWLILSEVLPPAEAIAQACKALGIDPYSAAAREAISRGVRRMRHSSSSCATNFERIQRASTLQSSEKDHSGNEHTTWVFIFRRIGNSLVILFGVILLTLVGLDLTHKGTLGLPVDFLSTITDLGKSLTGYLFNHPSAYIWHKELVPFPTLVWQIFRNSAGLLFLSLLLAAVLGISLGVLAASSRKRVFSTLVLLISIPGISTPSFLLGMLFWVLVIQISRILGMTQRAILPATGFGWDSHLVLPVLVLAARPLAQIFQVAYVNLSEALNAEYIRSANARGASPRRVILRHALPNILIPILTTLGVSLRYSLASLPVVESFFLWPGIGLSILQAIQLQMPELVTDLMVCLGSLFLMINLALDAIYRWIDPRLRESGKPIADLDETVSNPVETTREALQDTFLVIRKGIMYFFARKSSDVKSQSGADLKRMGVTQPVRVKALKRSEGDSVNLEKRWLILKDIFRNPLFIAGSVLGLGLIFLAIVGPNLVHASPYQTHSIMTLEGVVQAPPFKPSADFPWGSDVVGRDIQALILAGARQTLSLALFATLARIALGVAMGMAAGWWHGRWIDRLVGELISIWAAFPVTIFSMLIILALGIQKGMSVFVIAICVVGWGEVAQYVRGVIIAEKPRLYLEAARSLGARTGELIGRHILPQLVPVITVLMVLEMGSVLLLLAELGFLNIFLGGGFRVVVGEGAGMVPIYYYYSDVPEWGALLANIRNWWRSNPWMAWYPGVFFFISILTFNLWGEGLRRLIEGSRINISRLINRYTVVVGLIVIMISSWAFRANTPIRTYRSQAKQFDTERALADIRYLASPDFSGRESGLDGADAAARFLAGRMEEVGLFAAGEHGGYLREQKVIYAYLDGVPGLEVTVPEGTVGLVYRRDFSEWVYSGINAGSARGHLVGLALGEDTGQLTGKRLNLPREEILTASSWYGKPSCLLST